MKKRLMVLFILLFSSTGVFAYTRDWSVTSPIDHSLNRLWPSEIRKVRVDVAERLADFVSGFTAGETATGFKKIAFEHNDSSPAVSTDQLQIFTKEVGGKTELFMLDEDSNEQQLTSAGKFIGGMQGEIRMWSGTVAAIPTGWELADGSCSITCPDLRDRMIVGAKQDDSGVAKTNITGSLTASGGAATAQLTTTELPAHNHNTIAKDGSAVAHGSSNAFYYAGETWSGSGSSTTADSGIVSAGSGAAFSILNPYYALAFIIKD